MEMATTDLLGWMASGFMVGTFSSRSQVMMRLLAVCANFSFIGYALAASLNPVLVLHLVLLPVNAFRLANACNIQALRRLTLQRA